MTRQYLQGDFGFQGLTQGLPEGCLEGREFRAYRRTRPMFTGFLRRTGVVPDLEFKVQGSKFKVQGAVHVAKILFREEKLA